MSIPDAEPSPTTPRIRLGISACLLGEPVRFDGGHKRDNYIIGTLGRFFDFEAFCPEVAIGLGIPRPTLRIERRDSLPRVVGVRHPDQDYTDALAGHAHARQERLAGLSGFIFKKDSPSCGMERVKIYDANGAPDKRGVGAFAAEVMRLFPHLPCEEEGRLGDPTLRENFIERVLIHHRWTALLAHGLTPGTLVEFHTRHKLQFLAHNQAGYRRLGRFVAQAGSHADLQALAGEYQREMTEVLRRRATPQTHANVLEHLAGYLKNALDEGDRRELQQCIADYRTGQLPLIVPITLLAHHFRRHPHPWIAQQYYLRPHPPELALRNRI